MRTIGIAVLSFVVLSYAVSGIACTTIIVGKDATSDGSIIIARNEDSDGAVSPQNMIFHPSCKESWVFKSNSITNVLPFANSAKEGVRILGGLVEKMGAGEGFGVAFIDRHEAWYLETASGHHWLAMRIPDDS